MKKLKASAEKMISDAKLNGQTPEQATALDEITDQIVDLKAQIDSLDRAESIVGSLSEGTGRKTEAQNVFVGKDQAEDDPKRGFVDMADFALSVKAALRPGAGSVESRLMPLAATDMIARGGETSFEVPVEFRNAVWNIVTDEPDVFNLMQPEPTNQGTVEIPKDITTPWGADGVKAYWGAEAGQMSASNLPTESNYIPMHELYAFVVAGENLLEDAPRLSQRLTTGAGTAISWAASDAFINGDGVGKPLGIYKSGALVSVAKETSQTADTIATENISHMRSRITSLRNSFWLANSDALPQLEKMTIGDFPVFVDPTKGYRYEPDGILRGRPIYFSEHCKALGDKGDVYLIDPKGYAAFSKGGPKYAESIHLYFDYNKKAFRWLIRVGGMPYMNNTIARNNGSNAKGFFIAIADRA